MKEHSYGIIPVLRDGGRVLVAVVQHRAGHWGFPKGHPEAGEAPLVTARRELREELGVVEVAVDESHELRNHYEFMEDGVRHVKTVSYWLGTVKDREAEALPGELRGYRWVTVNEARGLLPENCGELLDEVARLLAA